MIPVPRKTETKSDEADIGEMPESLQHAIIRGGYSSYYCNQTKLLESLNSLTLHIYCTRSLLTCLAELGASQK